MNAATARSIRVTGASTGIGKASVLALLAEGFRVFAAVRNERAAADLAQAVPAGADGRLETLELDVTNAEQIRAAVARITPAVGDAGLWGLFNNAGIAVSGPLECLPIDDLRRQRRGERDRPGRRDAGVPAAAAQGSRPHPDHRLDRGLLRRTCARGLFDIEARGGGVQRRAAPRVAAWGIEVSLLEPGAIATEIWQKGASDFDGIMRDPPPGLVENYGGLVDALRKAAANSAQHASPTEFVTREVVHAFTATRPRTRYRMGKDSTSLKLISRLPDRWADALVAKTLGWG